MPKRSTKKTTRKPKKGRNAKGQFLKGYYQPCAKGSRIRKSIKKK